MSRARYILALDQGTTSSRAILFDRSGRPVASAQQEFPQGFPTPGHVTHDPADIWSTQLSTAREVITRAGTGPEDVAAIGLTNQRETTIVWDRATGEPIADAIVWQSRITAPRCEALRAAGHEPLFRERTGLPLDAYFSGPKIAEILDAVPGARVRAEAGELAAGTVDTFLLWRLTRGRVHATDVSNASRTLLLDLRTLDWDPELAALVGVPLAVLPEVRSSSEPYGDADPAWLGRAIPIAGIAGDQQAATFGQVCLAPGMAKNTYGTGAFTLRNVGGQPVASGSGLVTTVLWQLGPGAPPVYALEGSVFIAGAAIQWLRDGLRAIERSGDVEALAAAARDRVILVPAFTGLGAPHWDPDARGLLIGLTRGTGLAEIARAAVDSIALQVTDVLEAMAADVGGRLEELRVDGGAASNDALLQLQADLLEVPVERPVVTETTALGAAFLAGLAVGFWSGVDELASTWRLDRRFEPQMGSAERTAILDDWHRAVERSKGWVAR
jgi:glycerol kinase